MPSVKKMLTVACAALGVVTVAACGSGDDRVAEDSPYYGSLSELEAASDYALRISVTDVEASVVDGAAWDVVHGDVLASDPSFSDEAVTLEIPADTGTAESVEMASGGEYAIFVKVSDDGDVFLTSADQGVFPISDGVAGSSDAGTFSLGDAASRLGLSE
ncbi:hypothetical protein [Actinomyces sp. Z3]|uniref:hypothetical protein n=1 Tax=Actinomyces sp. Z3 TaxID=2250217 RepID=UPI000D59CE32|nr:hypothetical protein [Actinomyces sp. Z3]RAX23163.1 hypothetical protein DRB07_05175 [Actinomyces sp. Z3]